MKKLVLAAMSFSLFPLSDLSSQPAVPAPAFEAASVRHAPPPSASGVISHTSSDPGRLNYAGVTLKTLISEAYSVRPYQIPGPAWLESERYDIIATLPHGAPRSQIPLMFQTLLAERFNLRLHRETRELPVYFLLVEKNGPKLTKTKDAEVPGGSGMGRGHIAGTNMPMSALAAALATSLDRPVIDRTGLSGGFDLTLNWSPLQNGPPGADVAETGPDLVAALRSTLGLNLETGKAPLETLVIDHAEKVPTAN